MTESTRHRKKREGPHPGRPDVAAKKQRRKHQRGISVKRKLVSILRPAGKLLNFEAPIFQANRAIHLSRVLANLVISRWIDSPARGGLPCGSFQQVYYQCLSAVSSSARQRDISPHPDIADAVAVFKTWLPPSFHLPLLQSGIFQEASRRMQTETLVCLMICRIT